MALSSPANPASIFFGIMFLLSSVELGFTIYAFHLLHETYSWAAATEQSRHHPPAPLARSPS
jgi:hypothetical protein